MNDMRLTDLDELVQKVRDNKASRAYIIEAIDAYRGGAYRSAIVATWIAVVYDIIMKIQRLADEDDEQAREIISRITSAIQTANKPNKDEEKEQDRIQELQKIEREILVDAKNMGLLTDNAVKDFKALKKERNMCAHPGYVIQDLFYLDFKLYEPAPEQVRLHIVNAFKNLLQYAPQQIAERPIYALKSILKETLPQNAKRVEELVNWYFLYTTAHQLEKSIDFLIEQILKPDTNNDEGLIGKESEATRLLIAFKTKFHHAYESQMRERFPLIARQLKGYHLNNIFWILGEDPGCWNFLEIRTQNRIHAYLEKIENNLLNVELKKTSKEYDTNFLAKYPFFKAMDIDGLQPPLLRIFTQLQIQKNVQIDVMLNTPRQEFSERAVELYKESENLLEIIARGQAVLRMSAYLSPEQIIELVNGVWENSKICDAETTPKFLEELFSKTKKHLKQTHQTWRQVLTNLLNEADSRKDMGEPYSSAYRLLGQQLKKYGITPLEEPVANL